MSASSLSRRPVTRTPYSTPSAPMLVCRPIARRRHPDLTWQVAAKASADLPVIILVVPVLAALNAIAAATFPPPDVLFLAHVLARLDVMGIVGVIFLMVTGDWRALVMTIGLGMIFVAEPLGIFDVSNLGIVFLWSYMLVRAWHLRKLVR